MVGPLIGAGAGRPRVRRPPRPPLLPPPPHPRKGHPCLTSPACSSFASQCRPVPDGGRIPAATSRRRGSRSSRPAPSRPTRSTRSAIEAMAEEGIDITAETPKILTDRGRAGSDVVITMGCGDACPIFPGKRYEDWELDDPAGKGVDAFGRSATRSRPGS